MESDRASRTATVIDRAQWGAQQQCTGWNHNFAPIQLLRFDGLILRAAAANLEPLKQEAFRRSVFFWASASDVAEVVTATGPALVTMLGPVASASSAAPVINVSSSRARDDRPECRVAVLGENAALVGRCTRKRGRRSKTHIEVSGP